MTPASGHEPNAVNARGLRRLSALVGVSLASIVAAMYLLGGGLFGQPGKPQSVQGSRPTPHLQADPASELAVHRAREYAKLHRYAWVDRAHGIAQIPVERAMALLVTRPMQSPPAAGAKK